MENFFSWIADNYIVLTIAMSVFYLAVNFITKYLEKKQRKEKNDNGRDSSGNSGRDSE